MNIIMDFEVRHGPQPPITSKRAASATVMRWKLPDSSPARAAAAHSTAGLAAIAGVLPSPIAYRSWTPLRKTASARPVCVLPLRAPALPLRGLDRRLFGL